MMQQLEWTETNQDCYACKGGIEARDSREGDVFYFTCSRCRGTSIITGWGYDFYGSDWYQYGV